MNQSIILYTSFLKNKFKFDMLYINYIIIYNSNYAIYALFNLHKINNID